MGIGQTCMPLPSSFPTVRSGVSTAPGPGLKSLGTMITPPTGSHILPASIPRYIFAVSNEPHIQSLTRRSRT